MAGEMMPEPAPNWQWGGHRAFRHFHAAGMVFLRDDEFFL